MGATGTYLSRISGRNLIRECCPSSGNALRSGDKTDAEKQSMMVPASGKLTVDISATDYTVPEEVQNYTRGVSVNASGLVNLLLANDESEDLVYMTQGIFFPCQPLKILKANTAATGIRIYY